MCILIDITEQARESIDSTGKRISKSKAEILRNQWPDWPTRNYDNEDTGGVLTRRRGLFGEWEGG